MKLKIKYLCLLSLVFFQSHAQSNLLPKQQKISNSLVDYFKLDRENIHLHLNKTVYLTNEPIWFKGYIIEKKSKPTQNTSNVYVSLHDANGKKLTAQLYYAEGSIFEGRIDLDKNLKSGHYFLQVYTNFMNNFSEDESSIYEIEILNETEKDFVLPSDTINYNSTTISFFPESGIFLEGISNTIGARISDCNGNGIAVKDVEILDSKGNTVTTFSTDAFGYGKFEIHETKPESYTAIFNVKEKRKEQLLPMPLPSGISFSVDNYIFPEKTIVKLQTNSKTFNEIKNIPFNLVFQQDEAATFVDFSFNNTNELQFIIQSSQLPEGLNSVYLIDQNLNNIGERMIFNPYPMPEKTTLWITENRMDSLAVEGSSSIISGTVSISILPEATVTENLPKTIYSDFLFDNYLSKPSKNTTYYLSNFSRKKHYELDNFLLSQRSKYDWNTMMISPPTAKFTNDKGITIKGTVNSNLKNPKEITVNMNTIGLGINEFTILNDKKEFFFEHVMVQDSSKIYFDVMDQNEHKPKVKIYSQLLNNNRIFNKPIVTLQKTCNAVESKNEKTETISLPKIANSILLDTVSITGKKDILKHQKRIGNVMAKGFKISEADNNRYPDVLKFIGNNGFTVSSSGGKVSIINGHPQLEIAAKSGTINRSKKRTSAWSTNTYSDTNANMNGPAIFIDNIFVPNYDALRDYTMNQIDEIYINRMINDLSTYGSRGTIRIYTKTTPAIVSNQSNTSESLFVKNGFQKIRSYQNPKYDSVQDEGFFKLGTIGWKPIISTDENGSFHFSIPNLNQKSVCIIIEGLNDNGVMISEIQTLNLP